MHFCKHMEAKIINNRCFVSKVLLMIKFKKEPDRYRMFTTNTDIWSDKCFLSDINRFA